MQSVKTFNVLAILLFVFGGSPQTSMGQLDVTLNFEKETVFFSGSPFRWYLFPTPFGVDGIIAVSPGGTEVAGTFDSASFDSFEAFQNDVVGTWTLFFVTPEIQITFDVPNFELTDFPQFEVSFVNKGDIFFSGENIQTTILPSSLEPFSSGTSIIGASEANVNFLGNDTFEVILDLDNPEEDVSVTRNLRVDEPSMIQDLQGDVVFFELGALRLHAESVPVDFTVVPRPGLGDVNLDGVFDLRDVAPFIDVVVSGEFQVEADTNFDEMVDLQDVTSFVALLANQ